MNRSMSGLPVHHPLPESTQESIMQNVWMDESQVGIKIARKNINRLRYANDATLMAES